MRAVIVPEHGGIEVLSYVTDFPRPVPGPGEALVRVHTTGLNQIDRIVRMGYPGIGIQLPHIPGGDIAGVVEELGLGADSPAVGARVLAYPMVPCGHCALCAEGKSNLCANWSYFGLHRHGGYAEYAVVPAAGLLPLPDSVSFEQAAALPVAGLTAMHALTTVGQLSPGQSFFMWGGGGALGTMAIQIAKQLGATVIATAASPERLEIMRGLGADHVIDRNHDNVPARVAEICPAGVDLALDYVGPKTFNATMGMLKKGGTLLLCGMLTGRETTFNIQRAYLQHLSVKGLYLGKLNELAELIEWVAEGRVKPRIDSVIPLAEARRAHELLDSGQYCGKIVLTVD